MADSSSVVGGTNSYRAGVGGGLCSIGSFLLVVACCAELDLGFVEIVAVMGYLGFGCAIGVHFAVGYLDVLHLLPAFVGLIIFVVADVLLWIGKRRARRAYRCDASGSA